MKQTIFLFCLLFFSACQTGEECPPCAQGECINNVCACDAGYMGELCDVEKQPFAVTLTGLVIHQWPALDPSGNAWDINSAPDISFRLEGPGGVLFISDEVYQDAGSGPLVFSLNYTIQQSLLRHGIVVVDQDGVFGFEDLAGIGFTPWAEGFGFPRSLKYSSEDEKTVIELLFEYTHS